MSVCYDHLWSNGILLIATAMDPMLVILSSNHVGTSSSAPEEPKNTGLRLSACTREEETWRHLVTASFDQRNNSCSIGPDRTSHVVSWYHVINCNNGFYQSKHAASTKNSNAKDLSFSLPNKKNGFLFGFTPAHGATCVISDGTIRKFETNAVHRFQLQLTVVELLKWLSRPDIMSRGSRPRGEAAKSLAICYCTSCTLW